MAVADRLHRSRSLTFQTVAAQLRNRRLDLETAADHQESQKHHRSSITWPCTQFSFLEVSSFRCRIHFMLAATQLATLLLELNWPSYMKRSGDAFAIVEMVSNDALALKLA